LAGWKIALDAVGGTTHLTTVTDAAGDYSFTDLAAGTYRIREVTQPGWMQTTVNPSDITILSGSNITGIDFGNFQLGSIAGLKFQDSNGNGTRDPGEPGLAGWTIALDAVGGTTHLTTVTDAAGDYSFTDLAAGTYRIREVTQPGWMQTTVNPGDITILSGSNVTGIDFGNQMSGPPPIPPPILSKLDLFAQNLPGIANGMLAADSALVGRLYQTLLNRPVDSAGLVHWTELLLAGVSRLQIATAFWQSPEHRGVEVDQYYATYLGRGSDAAGRSAWVDVFLAGASEAEVIRGFLISAEYQAAHGTDTAFVNALYTQVLGRPADASGLATAVQALQGGLSRQALAQAFLSSEEAARKVVDEYYTLLLNRPPDSAGEQRWTDLLLRGGATFDSVGEMFLASDEYSARAARAGARGS
jgi:hypothetical protein